jgi:HD-like signal output (HDOD) protein
MTDSQIPALNLNKVLSAAQLPALPQSAIRLLELSQDPTNGPSEFAVPIESDPGLTGQVLRFVNSSYFGFSREISSIKLAITLVGIRTIKNFALWSAVFSLMPNPKCGPFDLKSLWQDSLRRALLARATGKLLGLSEAEELFSAALLQDMAVPVLAKEAPEAYIRLLESRDDGRARLSNLEQKHFGWTHAEAAGILARQWNLPDHFAVLIENHLDIERWIADPGGEAGNLAVAFSAMLPTSGDSTWHEGSAFEGYYERIAPAGGPTIAELLEQIDQEYADFAPVLQLATPAKSLVACHEEVAQASA